ncbi:MAG: hypothetical protein ACI89X_003787 [Planctomycetota bacterium]|jgi:hypothetical protein
MGSVDGDCVIVVAENIDLADQRTLRFSACAFVIAAKNSSSVTPAVAVGALPADWLGCDCEAFVPAFWMVTIHQ